MGVQVTNTAPPLMIPTFAEGEHLAPSPDKGLLSRLKRYAHPDIFPLVKAITGFSSDARERSIDDPAPVSYMKGCTCNLPFCQLAQGTGTIETDRLLQHRYTGVSLPGIGDPPSLSGQELIDQAASFEMQQAAISINRRIAGQMWSGSGNSLGEMLSIQSQIRGEHFTEAAPSMIGDIKDFGGYNVTSNTPDIVEYLSMMLWYLDFNARRSSLAPVDFIICMRPELWDRVSEKLAMVSRLDKNHIATLSSWTCSYCGSEKGAHLTSCIGNCGGAREPTPGQHICLYCGRVYHDSKAICWDSMSSTGCGAIESTVLIHDIEGLQQVLTGDLQLLDWLRRDSKALINGSLYDVVLDHAIPEQADGDGTFVSSIYVLPLSVYGGSVDTLRLDYVDYTAPAMRNQVLPPQSPNPFLFQSDHGMYEWQLDTCTWNFQFIGRTMQRVTLLTPQFAGVINNISYTLRLPIVNRMGI